MGVGARVLTTCWTREEERSEEGVSGGGNRWQPSRARAEWELRKRGWGAWRSRDARKHVGSWKRRHHSSALRRSVRALVSAFSMTLRPGRSELGEEGRGGEESIASRTLAPGCHARVVVRGREGKREGSPRAKRVNYLQNEL